MGRWCLMKQQKNIINLKEMVKVLACQYTIFVVQVMKAITSKESPTLVDKSIFARSQTFNFSSLFDTQGV